MENLSLVSMEDAVLDVQGTPVALTKPYFPLATNTYARDKITLAKPPLWHAPLPCCTTLCMLGAKGYPGLCPPSHTQHGEQIPIPCPEEHLTRCRVYIQVQSLGKPLKYPSNLLSPETP